MATQSIEQQQTKALTNTWVSGTGFDLQDLNIDLISNKINISISGSGEPPPLSELAPQIENAFGQPVEIELDVIPADEKHYPEPTSNDTPID